MKKEELALFLGVMCGDGCLSVVTKKKGYKNYVIGFYNTDIRIVKLFSDLFYKLFNVRGNFHPFDRDGRKRIYDFKKYSKELYDKIEEMGIRDKRICPRW